MATTATHNAAALGVADSAAHHLARWRLVALGSAGLGLGALTAAITLHGYGQTGLAAAGRCLLVIIPLGVGCYAAGRPSTARFGQILIVASFVSFLATLSEARTPILYSIGRISEWGLEVLLVYLVLSFPSGHLIERIDRALVAALVVLVGTLYLPSALFVQHYPAPSPYSSCLSGCPHNSMAVLGPAPAFVGGVLLPVRELLLILLLTAVTARLALRVRSASQLMRLTLTPVLAAAIVRLVAFVVGLAARRADAASSLLLPIAWLMALAVPLLAVGFLVGLVRWQLYVADALQRLAARLSRATGANELRAALADIFDDPALSVVYPAPGQEGRWLGAAGQPALIPKPGTSRSMTEVLDDNEAVAAIIHDAALKDHQPFAEAVVGYARMALENERLTAEVRASLEDVERSRARLLAAADGERRRIERDLHDGAQQRLVSLRMRLELAEDLLTAQPEQSRERLRALAGELDDALQEIRDLARGVYPPQLASEGLYEALRSAALRTLLPATVSSSGIRRYPESLESAAYFCCLEALQNACKHASGASEVKILLVDDGVCLSIEIRDDGAGFDPEHVSQGAGLMNMADRLAAVGGDLTVTSAAHHGTTVRGHMPLCGR